MKTPRVISSLKQVPGARRAALAALLLAAFAVALLAGNGLAAGGNLVRNASFERDSDGDGVPNSWAGYLLPASDKRVCNTSAAGACSFKMVADGDYTNLSQFVSHSGLNGDTFNFSAWIRRKDLVLGTGARVTVIFNHTGGGTNYETIEVPAGTGAWAKTMIPATADANYDDILILIINESTSGKMWFDQVKLVEGP